MAEEVTQSATPVATPAAPAAKGAASTEVVKKPKKIRRNVQEGVVHIQATYNNTIVSVSDLTGNVISWGSSGASGFKGTRKSTPYAASVAATKAAEKAKMYGLEKVHVIVKGIGSGREQAIRALQSNGLNVLSIRESTPVPHNGCRRKKARRV